MKNIKIVVALDSFKGTLTAIQTCRIVSKAIAEAAPQTNLVSKPMADGGEGTAKAMMAAKNGQWISKEVMGPLPDMKAKAGFAWFAKEKEALVEMAIASGIELLSREQLNPLKTTTYGTGQLIKAAIKYEAEKILLAVGGSATVDGGVGAAMALGWQFLDENGEPIPLGATGLEKIKKLIKPDKLNLPIVEVLCDVDNPLCGEHGAAKVYGPQKGATPEMVEQLENNLLHLSEIVKNQLNKDIENLPAAGAAGGLAGGAVAFMDATVVSGINEIIVQSGLYNELKSADWVITGEGSFDRQSLYGKVISGIAKTASDTNTKIAVLAGQVSVPKDEYKKLGIITAIACKTENMTLEYALDHSPELLESAAENFAKNYLL